MQMYLAVTLWPSFAEQLELADERGADSDGVSSIWIWDLVVFAKVS